VGEGGIGIPNAAANAMPGNAVIDASSYWSIELWHQLDDSPHGVRTDS
jgi:hypothetical protein